MPTEAMTAARFSITIDGYEIGTFSELAGLSSEVEPVDYLETADKQVALTKLPGKAKPPTVVLKRGKTGGMELWAWHEAVRRGDIAAARKNCTLVMYNTEGKPVARYYLEHAWPSKLEISALKAGSAEVLYETVTLTCEHLQRVAP
jgi:phage tail-like protein